MHISLDSALGRQRRLNQVGETITSIATPTAAYSLRSLTGGDPLAVRVRRSSGGTDPEKDFTVSQINSGALLDHVGSGNDGHVSIWYDQIGSNNLVQTTTGAQPLIVDSGSLFLNTDGKKGISIERSSTRETKLDFTSGFTIANSHTFQYLEFKRTFVDVLLSANGGGNIRIGRQSGTNLQIKNGTTQTFAAGITVHNNPFLYTTFLAADGSASKVHINGVEKQNTVYPDRDASQPNFTQIGKAGSNASTPAFILSELLMYSSEQSNRAAIEANMDSKYSIF